MLSVCDSPLRAPEQGQASAGGGTSHAARGHGRQCHQRGHFAPCATGLTGVHAKHRGSAADCDVETALYVCVRGYSCRLPLYKRVIAGDRLSLWEFYGQAFSKADKERMCPVISQTIRHVNRVSDWCKTAILESEDAKRRGATITLFVRALEELITLRNYSDSMSLVTALQATSVERLSKSWKHVSDDTVELHKKHKTFFDPRGNYSQLRKVIEATPQHEPIIPFLGIIMGDLIHVDEIPTKVNDALLNVHKLEMLAKQLALVPRYQKLHYALEVSPAFLDVFESTELLDESQVRERSRELEPPK